MTDLENQAGDEFPYSESEDDNTDRDGNTHSVFDKLESQFILHRFNFLQFFVHGKFGFMMRLSLFPLT